MKKVGIITDSTSCLAGELAKTHDIELVPLAIIHEGKTYHDGFDISPEEVYKIMRMRKNLPSTSAPSVGDFLECYCQLSQRVESILCIVLSSVQSNLFQVATMAKDQAREVIPNTTIEVIDSKAAAGSLGFVVLEAARAANRGADLFEVSNVAREMIPRVNLLAMVDTLFYLARTGRVGKASAWAGSMLKVKPILGHSTETGETTAVARPRTKEKGLKCMLDLMAERVGDSPVHVIVHHADEIQEGKRLMDAIGSRFNCTELHLTEFTSGMGAHCGPGVVGISFYID